MSDTVHRRPLQQTVRLGLWVIPLVVILALLLNAGAKLLPGGGTSAGVATPPPPLVTVSPPLATHAVTWTSFTGQFAAVDDVEIRAQVSGYLTEIHFKDGQIVHQGDLLFVIDPRPYQIQLEQAQASVLTARAQLALANKEEQRVSALQNSGAVTVEQLDQRVQEQAAAQAALDTADAAVEAARLNLEFCHITAPFSGRISSHRVSIGALISGGAAAASPTLLTTLVSLDPIYLNFQMSESDYLAYEHYVHDATPSAPASNTVQAALSDETGFPRTGTLDFVDNEIDPSSGTIQAPRQLSQPRSVHYAGRVRATAIAGLAIAPRPAGSGHFPAGGSIQSDRHDGRARRDCGSENRPDRRHGRGIAGNSKRPRA